MSTIFQADEENQTCIYALFVNSFLQVLILQVDSCAPLLIRSHIEICAAIVSACLPILRPLVELFLYKTGLRDKAPSQGAQSAWRSGVVTAGSDVGDHRVRSQAFQTLNKEDVWPPVANVSS